jgi:Asp-tRNA(Asn)/Glu-tRNA(Gln) amidotransferase A subunit family amidase
MVADSHYLSIAAAGELIRQKKVSPSELVTRCLKRIEQLNPVLNAFITVTADQALQEAQKAEQEIENGQWKGPLHGIPIGIKDMLDTAGIKTTAAFENIKDRIPTKDAESVTRLKEAGAIVLATRKVEDIAFLLNVLATPEVGEGKFQADHTSVSGTTKGPKICIVSNFKATDEVREAFVKTVEKFHSLGYTTTYINAPLSFPEFGVRSIDEDRKTISSRLSKDTDVLILPTVTDITPTIKDAEAGGARAVSADNTFFCNYYCLPAISVPCGFDKNNLPLGLQIVGPQWGENKVLDIPTHFSNR